MPRRRTWTVPAALAGALSLLLTACAPGRGVIGPGAPALHGGDPVGQWGEIADRSAYITILPDGTMGAHDGCNSMGGTWEVEQGVVQFDDVLMTLVACPGHEAWLRPATAVVRGDTLVVFDQNGDAGGTLPRVVDE
ncbi:META domain-containing protein [Microbacterium sp. CPCC 204701]|uniref:META domain-containing protein n=1 Tax=Microbacterium sp. CPCC 204701 TaxID=2493084 RepID=UPI000FD7680D|nr:META domain-containing protein [Microbacterium sp. CPCC 204701]